MTCDVIYCCFVVTVSACDVTGRLRRDQSGQHEFDFSVTRHGDGNVYVGVASPDIETDKTWCRKTANNKVRFPLPAPWVFLPTSWKPRNRFPLRTAAEALMRRQVLT
jgi:hypothetical protein